MKIILVALSLVAICNGFHIAGDVNNVHVDLEVSGLADVEELTKVDKSTQTEYEWKKYNSSEPIPKNAFQFWEMDKKKFYIGRASSPQYNKTVTVTIIKDLNKNNVFYDHSEIDESSVEILVGRYFMWVHRESTFDKLDVVYPKMLKNLVKIINNPEDYTKSSVVCRPVKAMRGYWKTYENVPSDQALYNVGQTGLNGKYNVCNQILTRGEETSTGYEVLAYPA